MCRSISLSAIEERINYYKFCFVMQISAAVPLQACTADVEDEETLKAVEAAVRESTSVRRIVVKCRHLNWTNVATALLKGATENKSLRNLTLQTAKDSSPPLEVVAELKQKRRKLLLRVNVEER